MKHKDSVMKDILTARREAGTPRGVEYANRLAAMPPDEAGDEIYDMFALCADEDLADEISGDLQLHPKAATRIAIAIVRKRAAVNGDHELARARDEEMLQMLRKRAERDDLGALEWGKASGEEAPADGPTWLRSDRRAPNPFPRRSPPRD